VITRAVPLKLFQPMAFFSKIPVDHSYF